MNLRELVERPLIHVNASPACNLACAYCSMGTLLTDRIDHDFLEDAEHLDFLARIPPSHLYVGGGEPLIHPGIRAYVAHAGRHGHRVTFDTNLVINRGKLESLLDHWDPAWIGYFNISHHILSGVPLANVLERARLLRARGVPFYVKYIGAPECFDAIEHNMKALRNEGFGAAATILYGPWDGRVLPGDYTVDEALRLLGLVTLGAHGLQVFGGVRSHGLPCRGGQDAIIWNMMDDRAVLPCCHGMGTPLDMDDTFFVTGDRTRRPCRLESCLGYTYFIYGINGIAEEIDRFEAVLGGTWDFLGTDRVLTYLQDIKDRGYRLLDDAKFVAARAHHGKRSAAAAGPAATASSSAPDPRLTSTGPAAGREGVGPGGRRPW